MVSLAMSLVRTVVGVPVGTGAWFFRWSTFGWAASHVGIALLNAWHLSEGLPLVMLAHLVHGPSDRA